MKVLIKFLGPIAKDDVEVEINSSQDLKEVIKQNVDQEWIEKIAVAVNDTIVSNLDDIKDGDVISLLPPVCGG